jgi:hypothetical protein
MKVQFVQPADGGTVTELQLQLLLEIAVEFDGRPMALAYGRRIFQHGLEQIAHALQFDFAAASRSGLGDQGINAAAIEQLNPQAQHPVGAGAEFADLSARVAQQQGAQGLKAEETAAVGRGFHRHAEGFRRGVLWVRLNFGRAQLPASAKIFQKEPELFSPIRKLFLRITLERRRPVSFQSCR